MYFKARIITRMLVAAAAAGMVGGSLGGGGKQEPDAASTKQALSASCKAGADQMGAFLPRIETQEPVTVGIDSRFTSAQQSEIMKSIDVWNDYGRKNTGRDFFRASVTRVPGGSQPAAREDCKFSAGEANGSGFRIVKEDNSKYWKSLNLSEQNGAATVRCSSGGKLLRQVVMINTTNSPPEQFMSISLHELGHTLGLGHSCTNGAGTADYASCGSLQPDHAYRVAVMYPVLQLFGDGKVETKELLRQNDTERTDCLYKP